MPSVPAAIRAKECTYEAEEAVKENPAAGYRAADDRFGASDFAPTPTEEANIDDGPTGAGTPGSGKLHVIPVAAAADRRASCISPKVASWRNPEQGKAANGVESANENTTTGGVNDPAGGTTTDSFLEETLRVHIPAQALEEDLGGTASPTWGEIPTPAGNGKKLGEYLSGAHTSSQETGIRIVENVPIRRIVRFGYLGHHVQLQGLPLVVAVLQGAAEPVDLVELSGEQKHGVAGGERRNDRCSAQALI